MAVYRRGYQRYQGPRTGRFTRLMVLPRYAWERLLEQRLVVIILILAFFWPLACGVFIYVANHAELWRGIGNDLSRLLSIDGEFFVIFMGVQSIFAVILAAFTGPSLIAPDLSNNALPLYFSRPLSRTDYVLARWMVLAGVLSVVTWIPGMLLFSMQSGLAGWLWFSQNWTVGLGLFTGFVIWILLVALVALACSAYVKWRIVAGALVLAFFFISSGVAEMLNKVLRVDWGVLLNPAHCMIQICRTFLGAEPLQGPNAVACAITLLIMSGLLLLVLERKLRPVEVIS